MSMSTVQPYQTEIGFLQVPHDIPFEGGKLVLLPEYEDRSSAIAARTHSDGYVYPPEAHPDELFKLKASHQLKLTHILRSDNPRFGDAGFILHAIGFAYGVRLQFSNWWFDSRVPINAGNEDSITINTASDFITLAYRKWRKFSPAGQNLSLNLLWMATRLKSYHTYWEKFLFSYMVIDGCYRLYVNEGDMSEVGGHGDRINALCSHFNIVNDQQHQVSVEKIVRLRNSLFHETLWSDQLMGSPGNMSDLDHVKFLKNLYRRILAAIFDFKGTYTCSPWNTIDKYWFSQ